MSGTLVIREPPSSARSLQREINDVSRVATTEQALVSLEKEWKLRRKSLERGRLRLGRRRNHAGDVFLGEHVDEVLSGRGLVEYADGSCYVGECFRNNRHGLGVYRYTNGDIYQGEWDLEAKHGIGTCHFFESGDRFEGEYRSNKRVGYGAYTWSNGSIQVAKFVDGKVSGPGVLQWQEGRVYFGDFRHDQREGYGVCFYPNGDVYEGEFKGDLRHGLGSYSFADESNQQNHDRGVWVEDELYDSVEDAASEGLAEQVESAVVYGNERMIIARKVLKSTIKVLGRANLVRREIPELCEIVDDMAIQLHGEMGLASPHVVNDLLRHVEQLAKPLEDGSLDGGSRQHFDTKELLFRQMETIDARYPEKDTNSIESVNDDEHDTFALESTPRPQLREPVRRPPQRPESLSVIRRRLSKLRGNDDHDVSSVSSGTTKRGLSVVSGGLPIQDHASQGSGPYSRHRGLSEEDIHDLEKSCAPNLCPSVVETEADVGNMDDFTLPSRSVSGHLDHPLRRPRRVPPRPPTVGSAHSTVSRAHTVGNIRQSPATATWGNVTPRDVSPRASPRQGKGRWETGTKRSTPNNEGRFHRRERPDVTRSTFSSRQRQIGRENLDDPEEFERESWGGADERVHTSYEAWHEQRARERLARMAIEQMDESAGTEDSRSKSPTPSTRGFRGPVHTARRELPGQDPRSVIGQLLDQENPPSWDPFQVPLPTEGDDPESKPSPKAHDITVSQMEPVAKQEEHQPSLVSRFRYRPRMSLGESRAETKSLAIPDLPPQLMLDRPSSPSGTPQVPLGGPTFHEKARSMAIEHANSVPGASSTVRDGPLGQVPPADPMPPLVFHDDGTAEYALPPNHSPPPSVAGELPARLGELTGFTNPPSSWVGLNPVHENSWMDDATRSAYLKEANKTISSHDRLAKKYAVPNTDPRHASQLLHQGLTDPDSGSESSDSEPLPVMRPATTRAVQPNEEEDRMKAALLNTQRNLLNRIREIEKGLAQPTVMEMRSQETSGEYTPPAAPAPVPPPVPPPTPPAINNETLSEGTGSLSRGGVLPAGSNQEALKSQDTPGNTAVRYPVPPPAVPPPAPPVAPPVPPPVMPFVPPSSKHVAGSPAVAPTDLPAPPAVSHISPPVPEPSDTFNTPPVPEPSFAHNNPPAPQPAMPHIAPPALPPASPPDAVPTSTNGRALDSIKMQQINGEGARDLPSRDQFLPVTKFHGSGEESWKGVGHELTELRGGATDRHVSEFQTHGGPGQQETDHWDVWEYARNSARAPGMEPPTLPNRQPLPPSRDPYPPQREVYPPLRPPYPPGRR